MTIFARSLASLAVAHTLAARRAAITAGIAALVSAGLLAAAAPSSAVVTPTGGTEVGLQPRNIASVIDGPVKENDLNVWAANPAPESFANPSGNPVLHSTNTYAIYWDPTDHYHGDWQHLVNTFLQGLGADSGSLDSVFSVDTQYTDASNKPAFYSSGFRGAYTDTHKYPAPVCTDPHPLAPGDAIACLTDTQLQDELTAFVAQHGLKKGMGTVYYLLTPPGVTVCVDGAGSTCSDYTRTAKEETEKKFESASYLRSFCSYHSVINPGGAPTGDGNTILYAAIPWTAGGVGDGHLAPEDRTPAYDCQDGGFDPSSAPIEKKEAAPVQQEPNQVGCPSPDGSCDTGLADLIINQIAVEQQNTVTNPLLNSWQDSAHNEATDECRNFFAPVRGGGVASTSDAGAGSLYNQSINGGNYYLNTAFNLAALRLPYPAVPCLGRTTLEPAFTAPNPVNSGEVAGFDGMESDISLNAAIGFSALGAPQPNYATFSWSFGDGTAPVTGYAPGAPACEEPWLSQCAASVFHTFQYGGTYPVTLTVTDVGGHVASTSSVVTVNGPPAPSSASSGSSSAGSSSAAASSTPAAAAPATASKRPLSAPMATAAALPRSLRGVLSKGLPVRYSVNQQVAGHFEVLLSRATARRLKIGGAPATGLPAGTPPQVVIAKAILVTTAAGRSTVTIHFSKHTASRLESMRTVALMLRLVVRNASSQSPATTTVLSKFVLHR